MAATITVLSLTGASMAIISRTVTIGRDLHVLKSKLTNANRKIQHLHAHVSAVRAAAHALSAWLSTQPPGSPDVEEIKMEIFEVLYSSLELLLDLQNHIESVLAGGDGRVRFKGAARNVWDEEIVRETVETLRGQETALLLMLETLRLTRKSEKAARLHSPQNEEIIEKAKRRSSSIFGAQQDSRRSVRESRCLSIISLESSPSDSTFIFDEELAKSSVYQNLTAGDLAAEEGEGKSVARVESTEGNEKAFKRPDSMISVGSEKTLVATEKAPVEKEMSEPEIATSETLAKEVRPKSSLMRRAFGWKR